MVTLNKCKLLRLIFAASSIALASGAFLTDALAQNKVQAKGFFCGKSNGVPATLARTNRGEIPVIQWTSERFREAGYSPEKRCQEVSARFQRFFINNQLNYLTTGMMNNQQVVCIADREGGNCTGLLFTLKPGSNANQVLSSLLAVRVRASAPLNESTSRVYINITEYLQEAAAETESNSPSDRPIW
ncbi:MAG: COP23 domain-containing protein [Microcoleus sp.]